MKAWGVAACCIGLAFASGCATPRGAFDGVARIEGSTVERWLGQASSDANAAAELGWTLWMDDNDVVPARDWFREAADRSPAAFVGAAEIAYWGGWSDEAARRWASALSSADPALARLAITRLVQLVDRSPLAAPLGLEAAAAAYPRLDASNRLAVDRARVTWSWRAVGTPTSPATSLTQWRVAGPLAGPLWLGWTDTVPALRARVDGFRESPSPLGPLLLHPHRPGLFFAEGRFDLSSPSIMRFAVTSEAAVRLLVDGNPIAERAPQRSYPPRTVEGIAALDVGSHRIELIVGTRSVSDTVWVQMAPEANEQGAPPATSLPQVLEDWLEAQVALVNGHAFEAHLLSAAIAHRAPQWAPILAVAASIQGTLPSHSPSTRKSRLRAGLRQALERDPGLMPAALALIEESIAQGELALARETVERAELALQTRWGSSAALRAQSGRVLAQQGLDVDAERAWEEALASHPGQCAALEALTQRAWNRPTLDSILLERGDRLAGCPATKHWIISAFRRRGDLARAFEALRTARALEPDDEGLFRIEVDLLTSQGRVVDVERALAEREQRFPNHGDYAFTHGDVHARAGQATRAFEQWRDLVRSKAARPELHRRLALLDLENLWTPFALDPFAIAAAPATTQGLSDAGAVILLDDEIAIYFQDGSLARRTHVMTRLQSELAVQQAGEVSVAPGSDVLWVRTIKPDGRVVEPEDILEKDTTSLTDLEIGDVVDIATIAYEDGDPRLRHKQGVRTFVFGSHDAPVELARFVVGYDSQVPLQVHVRADPNGLIQAEPTAALPEGFTGAIYTARRLDQMRREHAAIHPLALLPHVQAWSAGWDDVANAWRDHLARHERLPPDLLERLGALRDRHPEPTQRAQAVYSLVRRHVTQAHTSALGTAADEVWAERQGERAPLLAAALRASGITAEIVLVNPIENMLPYVDVPPSFDVFSYPVVLAKPGEADLWLDLTIGDSEYAYLAPSLQRRPAHRLSEVGAPFMTTPTLPLDRERRRIEAVLSIDPNGVIEGTWTDSLRGVAALAYRNYLVSASPGESTEALRRMVDASLPGVRLLGWDVSALRDPEQPLTLSMEVFAAPSTPPEAGTFLVTLRAMPERLTTTYATAPERTTPIIPDVQVDQEVVLTLDLGEHWDLNGIPAPVVIENAFTRYERKLEQVGTVLELKKTWSWRLRVVEPPQYAEFFDTAARIDRADEVVLSLRRK